MKKVYKIADLNILIETNFDYIDTRPYKPFLLDKKIEDLDKIDVIYKFESVDKGMSFDSGPIYEDNCVKIYEKDGEIYRVLDREYKNSDYLYMKKYKDNIYKCYVYNDGESKIDEDYRVFNALGFEKMLNEFDVLYLHASFIKWKEQGVLFTAPCGVGKSTQANLWKEYENAEIINGDKALIRKIDESYRAYGLPYAGSSSIYVNNSAEIGAIVVLRQAKENKLERLSQREAFKLILSETTVNFWDDDFTNNTVDIIIDLVSRVPVYKLSCTISKEAVDILKEELTKIKGGDFR